MQQQDVARAERSISTRADAIKYSLAVSVCRTRWISARDPDRLPWNGAEFVLCTVPDAPKVSALSRELAA